MINDLTGWQLVAAMATIAFMVVGIVWAEAWDGKLRR